MLIFLIQKNQLYTITKYSRLIVSNEEKKKLAIELIESLENINIKKVENIDNEVKENFRFLWIL